MALMFPTCVRSPFRNVSYDVLREIFFHCLPSHPLDEVQPNANIAPILLCHVCSSWRIVALSSPSLWTHLHIKLPLLWNDEKEPIVRDREALARDTEFMKWWRSNHSPIPPFLRFNLHRRRWREENFLPAVYLAPDIEIFFFDYMSSAQYLDVGLFYTYLTRQVIKRGLPVTTFAKLHTLVSHGDRSTAYDDPEDEYFHCHALLPSQIPPTVRRLSIQGETIQKDYLRSLDNLSTLTHISLHLVWLSVNTWFCLIRQLENLQRGDFSLSITRDTTALARPPQFTLPSLSTLSIFCYSKTDHFRLSTLFRYLQLPALHTLSLLSTASSWTNYRVTADIHNVLKSAPEITKLFLGTYGRSGFLCFEDDSGMPSAIGATDKRLSMDAPHLSHLQVELPCITGHDLAVLARRFVKEFFVSNRWLDLASPTNSIRTITIAVENGRSDAIPDFDDIIKDLLLWNIQKYVTTATNVSFEIGSVNDIGMHSISRSARKTWGSKIY